ncbi:MAG: DUF1840 domain-containing protein [Caldimonas sp.]|uniref:DUF1840 domain-containing protein n=1 Tax=Caldimonas sp. TaxID=2838790 RepID=UPI0039190A69
MLYKFRSKAAGDVIMMGVHGDHVMRLIGKTPGQKGILVPMEMPAAIAALERAIAQEEAERRRAEEEAQAEGRSLPPQEGVTLRQRLWPLMEMIRRCHEADQDIVWGV